MNVEEAWRIYAQHISPGKVQTYKRYGFDPVMGRREGARFYDAGGERAWINCHCNGGVFNLGHRNPQVTAAVQRALEEVDIGNHHLISPLRAELANRLLETTEGLMDGVIFGVSGGEAIDLAIKACRGATGRPRIISALGGYHGHTGLAMAAGDEAYRAPFGESPRGSSQAPFADLNALTQEVVDQTAAVLLEPIPATLGMPIPPEGYLQSVSALCEARGAKLIVDEVQTGLGRTGDVWCYQGMGARPDVLVTGKGLSGGLMPISATLMSKEIFAFFQERPFVHISTFGGAELACAAALEVLKISCAPSFLERVQTLAARVRARLSGLPFTLRQRGLMMGIKLEVEDAGLMAAKMLFDRGVFTVYAANDTSVLQFLPPLTISDEELEEVLTTIESIWSP